MKVAGPRRRDVVLVLRKISMKKFRPSFVGSPDDFSIAARTRNRKRHNFKVTRTHEEDGDHDDEHEEDGSLPPSRRCGVQSAAFGRECIRSVMR